jgi:lipopolysaccharide export system protein LptA
MMMALRIRNFRFRRSFVPIAAAAAACWAVFAGTVPEARAQDLVSHPAGSESSGDSGGFDFGNSSQPIDISADNGIEWNRDAKTYTARGNAVASQGESEVHADTLVAYYTTDSNQIARVVAEGNVKMMNATETAYGDHADYDRGRALLVMTGHALKVESTKQTITARDRMEYWHDRDVMVARGNVVIAKDDGTVIHTDLATAYYRKNAQTGKREMFQVKADGNVHIVTDKDDVTCEHAVYDPITEISVLTGNVVLKQNGNVFRGARAEIDSKTGVSRLFPATGQRVHSVIQPKKNPNDSAPGTNAPAQDGPGQDGPAQGAPKSNAPAGGAPSASNSSSSSNPAVVPASGGAMAFSGAVAQ